MEELKIGLFVTVATLGIAAGFVVMVIWLERVFKNERSKK